MTDTDGLDIRAELEANRRRGREIDERLERWDRDHGETRRRLELVRQSMRASLDGDHERAGELLDELDALDGEEGERAVCPLCGWSHCEGAGERKCNACW